MCVKVKNRSILSVVGLVTINAGQISKISILPLYADNAATPLIVLVPIRKWFKLLEIFSNFFIELWFTEPEKSNFWKPQTIAEWKEDMADQVPETTVLVTTTTATTTTEGNLIDSFYMSPFKLI